MLEAAHWHALRYAKPGRMQAAAWVRRAAKMVLKLRTAECGLSDRSRSRSERGEAGHASERAMISEQTSDERRVDEWTS